MKKIVQTLKRPWSWVGAALLLGSASYAGIAYAGATWNSPVYCESDTEWAWCFGALGPARNSSNSYEQIGCTYTAGCRQEQVGYGGDMGEVCNYTKCVARVATGQQITCWSDDPQFRDAMATMNGDSYIEFSCGGIDYDGKWGPDELTLFKVTNGSQFAPKKLDRVLY